MNRRSFLKNLLGGMATAVAAHPLLSSATSLPTVPEIDIPLEIQPVVPKIHKLKCRWTLESAKNLRAAYGVDSAEDELVQRMSDELRRETKHEAALEAYC